MQGSGRDKEDEAIFGEHVEGLVLSQENDVLGHVMEKRSGKGLPVSGLWSDHSGIVEQGLGGLGGEGSLQLGLAVADQAWNTKQTGDGEQLEQIHLRHIRATAVDKVHKHEEGLVAEEAEPHCDAAWLRVLLSVVAHQLHELAAPHVEDGSVTTHSRLLPPDHENHVGTVSVQFKPGDVQGETFRVGEGLVGPLWALSWVHLVPRELSGVEGVECWHESPVAVCSTGGDGLAAHLWRAHRPTGSPPHAAPQAISSHL